MIEPLVRRFHAELWDAGLSDPAPEILHPELAFRGSLGPERRGIAGFLSYRDGVRAALADYRCDIVDLVATDERAAARMHFHGRHTGPLMGHAPTGSTIAWAGAAFFTARDQRLAEIWVLGDIDAIRTQLAAAVKP